MARVASAPNPAMPYLAEHQSRSSPGAAILGWFATAVEAAVSYARHVLSQQEAIEGAAVGAAEGSAEPDAATMPAATMAPSPAAEVVEEPSEAPPRAAKLRSRDEAVRAARERKELEEMQRYFQL